MATYGSERNVDKSIMNKLNPIIENLYSQLK